MKKFLSLILLLCLSVTAVAQNALTAGTYYIQNVVTGTYLSSGANWGTRAVLSPHGVDFKVTVSNGAYTLITQIQGANQSLRPSDGYMDQSGTWTIEPLDDGTYAIFNGTNYFGYDKTNANPWIPRLTFTSTNDVCTHWRFLTKEQLLASLSTATYSKPVDASFMMQAPDMLIGDYRITGSRVWGKDIDNTGGNVEGDSHLRNNAVAECYNKASFNVTQTLKNVPDGVYSLSVQGFYRNGSNTNAAAAHNSGREERLPYLYANDRKSKLPSVYSEAKKTAEGGWVYSTAAGYVPNFMDHAAACFDSGENVYLTTIKDIVVLDGKLTIGIEKKEKAVESDWMCFDNFTLMYYGNDMDVIRSWGLKEINNYETLNTTGDTELAQIIDEQRIVVQNALTSGEIKAAVEMVETAYKLTFSKPEPTDKAIDLTNLILNNPSFDEATKGWQALTPGFEGNRTWDSVIGDPSTLEVYAGFSELEINQFNLSQKVALSPGMYRLRAFAFYRYGLTYDTDLKEMGEPLSYAELFAGDNRIKVMRLGDVEQTTYPNNMQDGAVAFKKGQYVNTLVFEVEEPCTIDVGIDGTFPVYRSWLMAGPMTLEKINVDILLAEGVAEFEQFKKTYVTKWNNYKVITNQAINHEAFDQCVETSRLALEDVHTLNGVNDLDATVWESLCSTLENETTETGQFDITALVQNPSFTKNTSGWHVENGLGWGDAGVSEIFNKPEGVISQTLEKMPKGSYTLKAQAFYRMASVNVSSRNYEAGADVVAAELFFGNTSKKIKSINDDARERQSRPGSDVAGAFDKSIPNTMNGASAAFDSGLYWNLLVADNPSKGDVTFGIKYKGGASSNWLCFDNFRLYYGAKTIDLNLSEMDKFPLTEDVYANVTTDIQLKAGQLNALCLPFDMDMKNFESVWTIAGVDYDKENATLTGTLIPVKEVKAGVPCFVKVTEDKVLKADNILVRAAAPDSIPMMWEGGALTSNFNKAALHKSFRLNDDGQTMTYGLARLNYPGYKAVAVLPEEYYSKVKTLTLKEVDYQNMDITINLENSKVRNFLATARYHTSISSSIVSNYTAGPPARIDAPHTAMVPLPVKNTPSFLQYSLNEDFSDDTTINIPAKSDVVEVANLYPQKTYFYRVINGKTEIAKGKIHTLGNLRMIKVKSGSNVRDLGGWLTLDGNRTNYGLVYRGGEMNAGHVMNEADRNEMLRLGIGAEVDLRQDADFGDNIISHSALGTSVPYIYLNQSKFNEDALQDDVDKYARIFPFILDNLRAGNAVYFHCIWGADRTGALGFLLDGLCGLTLDQMYKDYELTSFSIAGLREKTGLDSKFEYINTFPGITLQQRFFNYWVDVVGMNPADLAEFIQRMTNGTPSIVTAIESVDCDNQHRSLKTAEFYTIDGRRIPSLKKGVNIIRYSDGTTKKVVR